MGRLIWLFSPRNRYRDSIDVVFQKPYWRTFLLPIWKSALRQALDDWFEAESITPRVLGEFQDTALIDVFAQSGAGIFAAPVAIEREIRTSYHVVKLGTLSNHTVSYYAISGERKIKHPAVTVIAEAAQTRLFRSAPA